MANILLYRFAKDRLFIDVDFLLKQIEVIKLNPTGAVAAKVFAGVQ